ncbi:MAG: leucine-rich repeat protein, partial [Clostridiales bacterium]|nr:leucine-rich repeat protein [Clostridiales bacterium]
MSFDVKKAAKRVTSGVVALLMAISIMPLSIFADSKSNGESSMSSDYNDNDKVRLIIELESSPMIEKFSADINSFSAKQGQNEISTMEKQHNLVKNQIALIEQGKSAASAKAGAFSMSSLNSLNVIYDYYTVLNGFSIETEYGNLDEIKDLSNVKNVWVAQQYQLIEPQTSQSTNLIGSDIANLSGYTGKGTTIAIIDSGIKLDHEAFSVEPDAETLKHSKESLKDYFSKSKLSAEVSDPSETYYNDKLVYSYDYAGKDSDATDPSSGHGTHVAGIAAGNNGDDFKGVAPDAQLMILKVFGDYQQGAYESDILAALDDAVKLGVDSINMSLGSMAGFSEYPNQASEEVYERVRSAGINLAIAAGNDGSSAQENTSGMNLPYASNPDNSTVGSPSTYAAGTSVASVTNSNVIYSPYFKAGDRKITYKDAGTWNWDMLGSLEGEYEFVDCGIGSESDYENANGDNNNLKGKIALIKNEDNDDFFKYYPDYSYDLKAIIVYNDTDDGLPDSIETGTVPVSGISKADGEYLLSLEDKKIDVSLNYLSEGEIIKGGAMADYSSWGVTPDMKLKPEISAPGSDINSAYIFEEYTQMSGTSMASPHVAGAFAILKQYVNEKYPAYTEKQKQEYINSVLMSTAVPSKESQGNYYSPRRQGSGVISVEAAVIADSYLTVEGMDKPKAELGDSLTGEYEFSFYINNLTDEDTTYSLSAAALTENVIEENGKKLFEEKSRDITNKADGVEVKFSGAGVENDSVLVKSGENVKINVSIKAESEFIDWVNANAENGTFIDGFVFASAEDKPQLSVPFLAFLGDWDSLPILDELMFNEADEENEYQLIPTTLTRDDGEGGRTVIGYHPFYVAKNLGYNSEWIAISPYSISTGYKAIYTQTGLLRNVQDLKYTFKDEDGNVIKEYAFNDVMKSVYHSSVYRIVSAEDWLGENAPVFDGKDENGNVLDEGIYSITISANNTGNDEEAESKTMKFRLDTTAPELDKYEIIEDGEKLILRATARDNHTVSGIIITDKDGIGNFNYTGINAENQGQNADGTYYSVIDVDITGIDEYVKEDDEFSIYLYDFALNLTSEMGVVNPEEFVEPEAIEPEQGNNITITNGKDFQLSAKFTPENTTNKRLKWTSSDESVAVVDSKTGLVTAKKAGTTEINAETYNGIKFSQPITLTVEAIPEDVGIVIAQSEITVEAASTPVQLRTTVNEDVIKEPIVWKSHDESIATVSEDGLVKGIRVGQTTVSASASGKTATVTVIVKANSNFVIDEYGVLTEWKRFNDNSGGDIEIPEGVVEIAPNVFDKTNAITSVKFPSTLKKIGRRAFYFNDGIKELIFNEGLEFIDEEAFYDMAGLEKVVLPKTLKEVGERAFSVDTGAGGSAYTSKLNEVYIAGGLKVISKDMFANALQLSKVTIEEGVEEIGDNAFYNTLSLGEIKLPSTIKKIGDSAFFSSGIKEIVLPEGITEIPHKAFAVSSVQKVTFSSTIKTIKASAFNQSRIKDLVIPDTVETIEDFAFANIEPLSTVKIGKGVTSIGFRAFSAENLALSSIEVDEANPYYDSDSGVLFNEGKTKLIQYTLGKKADNYVYPEQTDTIGAYAFYGVSSLNNLVIPEQIKTIENYAFSGIQSIKSIDLGNGVESIGECSFANTGATSLKIGDSLVEIADKAFINVPLSEVEFGKSIKKIGSYAFQYHNIRDVVLPDYIEEVGENAFANNYEMKSIRFGAGINKIGKNVLSMSNQLEAIYIPKANDLTIEADTFGYLQYATGYFNTFKTLVLGEGITAIEDNSLPILNAGDNGYNVYLIENSPADKFISAKINEGIPYERITYSPIEIEPNAEKTRIVKGDKIKVSADLSGGIGDVVVRFRLVDKDGNESVLSDYSDISEIEWTSPDESSYTIYIDVKDSLGIVKTSSVDFVPFVEILPEEITAVSEIKQTLKKGESAVLEVKVNPLDADDKSVEWTSSDDDVVSVENGEIKAL